QYVLLYEHHQAALGLAHCTGDGVNPLDQLAGQRALGGGDAEAAGGSALLEDDVLLGIADREGDFFTGQGALLRQAQAEGADLDRLAGMVDRLDAGEHQSGRAAKSYRRGDLLYSLTGPGADMQLVVANGPVGQLETRLAAAVFVGLERR